MKRNARIASDRLRNIIMNDKVEGYQNLENLIRSDILALFESYFEMSPPLVEVSIRAGEYGIEIDVHGEAQRAKGYGGFSK